MAKEPKLGIGKRFEKVEAAAKKSGAKNPAAVAYIAGVKAHGKEKMAELAKKGRERATKKR